MVPIVPVVLSGGSGTRLWPLSRERQPKQFLPLVDARSLFQDALERPRGLAALRAPIVVCNALHRDLVLEQLHGVGMSAAAVVLEPVGRNTAPAVGVAALVAQRAAALEKNAGDPLLLVMPADHVVLDRAAFLRAVEAGVAAARDGCLVTFGVVPSGPETGYGYVQRGADRGGYSFVARFVEKPDFATAQRLVESGEYLWNSGMFLFSASAYLAELRKHEPAMASACERTVAEAAVDGTVISLGAAFAACSANSIDYAVMEKTDRAAVVPLAAGWSDVGSWPALAAIQPAGEEGNVTSGDVIVEGCRDTYVAAHSRLVAAVGLTDVIVVETPDAVLVLHRERAQDVKAVVEALRKAKRPEV
jgi:mannose-1-phosphate guanylyltransferase/mannose-6-phosphate isomerase